MAFRKTNSITMHLAPGKLYYSRFNSLKSPYVYEVEFDQRDETYKSYWMPDFWDFNKPKETFLFYTGEMIQTKFLGTDRIKDRFHEFLLGERKVWVDDKQIQFLSKASVK